MSFQQTFNVASKDFCLTFLLCQIFTSLHLVGKVDVKFGQLLAWKMFICVFQWVIGDCRTKESIIWNLREFWTFKNVTILTESTQI